MNPESARPAEKGVPDAAPVRKLLQAFESLSREGADEPKLFQEIHSLYRNLSEEEKEPLFAAMIQEIEVSKDGLGGILEKLLSSDPRDPQWPLWISELRNRIRSPRLHILRKISHQPGGLKFLLDLRGDVLSVQRFSSAELAPLDMDLVLLFELWFQDGFLYLEEITFDSSYRQIELIKNSDLVHPMTGIEEMGKRLGRDRRCFALYHRLMPYEPVVFIEVALTRGIVRTISEIIHPDPERAGQGEPDTAIFYSINNTQQGLSGLRLGKMLIYRVVDYLREKEQITTFATLSPITGFWRGYLKPILEGKDTPFLLKAVDVQTLFPARHVRRILESGSQGGEPGGLQPGSTRIALRRGMGQERRMEKGPRRPSHPDRVSLRLQREEPGEQTLECGRQFSHGERGHRLQIQHQLPREPFPEGTQRFLRDDGELHLHGRVAESDQRLAPVARKTRDQDHVLAKPLRKVGGGRLDSANRLLESHCEPSFARPIASRLVRAPALTEQLAVSRTCKSLKPQAQRSSNLKRERSEHEMFPLDIPGACSLKSFYS